MKKNKKNIIIILVSIISILMFCIFLVLVSNKTFFKTTYIGKFGHEEFFVPRFSYFKDERGMTSARFFSLKSKKKLQREIDNYLKEFEYFEGEGTYGYRKDNLFIQKYYVINRGWCREIILTY